MANVAVSDQWPAIQADWQSGVPPKTLSKTYGVAEATIRKRADRKKWLTLPAGSNAKIIVEKAAKRAVAKAVAKRTIQLQRHAEYSVEACVAESIDLGRSLMSQAKEKVFTVEDGNLSGVATLARAGVDIARKSLGLDTTGSGSISCAIQFNFVARGSDCNATPATLPVAPDATIEVETISGDSQPD